MPDATLRMLETLRAFGAHPGADRAALEAFTYLIAAPAPCAVDPLWIGEVVDVAMDAPPTRSETFRRAYALALEGNGGARYAPASQRTMNALALEGLLELPPRERAVLALSCLLGFTDAELAVIIDEPPAIARTILDATVDLVRNAASRRRSRDGRAA